MAAFIEVFARLLTRLAGFAARIIADAPPPEPRVTPTRVSNIATPVVPGLLPRMFGWLGGMPPIGGPIALPRDTALRHREQPSTPVAHPRIASAWVPAESPAQFFSRNLGPSQARAMPLAFVAAALIWRDLPRGDGCPPPRPDLLFKNVFFRPHRSTSFSLRYRN